MKVVIFSLFSLLINDIELKRFATKPLKEPVKEPVKAVVLYIIAKEAGLCFIIDIIAKEAGYVLLLIL